MKRPRTLVVATILVLAIGSFACRQREKNAQKTSKPNAAASEVTLQLASFGGSFQQALNEFVVQPIAKKIGVKAEVHTYGGEYDQLAATIRDHTCPYDLVHVETRFVYQGGDQGLLVPIDYGVVDRNALIAGASEKYGVGLLSWSLVLSWNSSHLPPNVKAPSNWRDLFDTKRFPGPRALRKTPEGNLEAALLADGVSPSKLYEGGLDVGRALKKLSSIRKNITWWSSGAELEQKLTSSASLAAAWNGRVTHLAKAQGVPVALTFNEGIFQFDWWVIPVSAPHRHEAMLFLKAFTSGTGQGQIAEKFGYGPTSKAALAALSPQLRKEVPSSPENLAHEVVFNGRWWADHTAEITKRWNQWLLGGSK